MILRLLVLFLTAALASTALADTEYCVSSPASLQSALDQAEVDLDDSLIKVQSGTYNLSTNLVYNPELEYIIPIGRLTIRGGYNAGCTSYSLTPGATTITSSNQSALRIRTSTGHASIAGLTFQGSPLEMFSPVLSACPSQRRTFKLLRVRVNQAMFEGVAWCHNVLIENSLFTNSIATSGSGYPGDTGVGIYLAYNDDTYDSASKLTMINSTVANGRMDLASLDDGRQGAAYLYNSIFHRPAGNDISSEAHIFVRHSRFDGISYSGGAFQLSGSGGNVSATPQLDVNYVPVAGSPMINAGTSIVPDGLPATDHAGSDRVIGANVDIGALESPIDGTGVYVVTNTNASGAGSLVQALANANAESGFNRIDFNISGSCPRTISLSGALQVRDGVSFNGWSQPGSVLNTSENGFNAVPCVVLSGNGGIGIEAMGTIGSGRISVSGLAFQGFDLAIALAFGSGHTIYGNQFGGRIGESGPVLSGNMQGIALIGGGDTIIGGTSLAYRNLIGDSSDVGVLITTFLGLGGDDNSVLNNLIGVDKNGSGDLGNGTGLRISGGYNLIRGNRIGRNTIDGILLTTANAEGNRIEDNHIGGGVDFFGSAAGNGRMGVMVQSDAHDNVIGPDNNIGRNGDDGVRIMPTAGGRNRITGNRIGRNSALGIDLNVNGVGTNTPDPVLCDPDLGCAANRDQNYPILSSAERRTSGFVPVGRPIRVTGTLRSTFGGPYRLEVFAGDSCDANGYGEGITPVAAAFLTIENQPYCPGGPLCFACTDFNCTAPFTVWLPEAEVAIGDTVTVTATSSGGDTSEFSACMTVVEQPDNDLIFADGFED